MISRLGPLALVVLLQSGCGRPEARTCSSGGDCETGEACEAGFCIATENVCAPACEPYQQCVSDSCASRFSGIGITEPTVDTLITAGLSVTVKAKLQVHSGLNLGTDAELERVELQIKAPDGGISRVRLTGTRPEYRGSVRFEMTAQAGVHEIVAQYMYVDAVLLSSTPRRITVTR